MTNQQGRIIDINRWYRTGGIDYPKLKESVQPQNVVIIQACAGTHENELLEEQAEGCLSVDIDIETFGVPAAWKDPVSWADYYMSLPYVMDNPKWIDNEPTGGTQVNQYQLRKIKERIDSRSKGPAGYYSNYPYTNNVGNPAFIKDMDVWWAEYPLHWRLVGWYQYQYFHTYEADKAWWLPKWASRLGITPIVHQFTEKGRAQHYGAKPFTDDPDNKVGIQSMDLSLTLIDDDEYRTRRFTPYKDVPPVPPTLADHEKRIRRLEGFHNV